MNNTDPSGEWKILVDFGLNIVITGMEKGFSNITLKDVGKAAVDSAFNAVKPLATVSKLNKLRKLTTSTNASGRLARNAIDTAKETGNDLLKAGTTDFLGLTETSGEDIATS